MTTDHQPSQPDDRYTAQLRGLAQAALAINSGRGLAETLQLVTDQARARIGAHQAVTSMTTGEDWSQAISAVSLSEKYAPWQSSQESSQDKPDGSGFYALVCRENRPMRMTQAELEAHPAWRGLGKQAAAHPPMRGCLAVPLVDRQGKNLGLIQLSDKFEGDFDDRDEAVLVQLAQLASVAIENARLYRDLKREEERYRSLVTATAQTVWTTDAGGEIVGEQPSWQAFTGQGFEAYRGQGWLQALHPDDREQTARVWSEAVAGRQPYETEYRLRRRDGAYRKVWVRGVPIYETDGGVREWVGTCTDITERRAAEERIAFQASLLEQVYSAVLVTDLEGKISYWNSFAEALYGWSAAEVIGRSIEEITVPADAQEASREIMSAVFETGRWEGEFTVQHRDGTKFPALVTLATISDLQGKTTGIVGVSLDISERKRAEQEKLRLLERERAARQEAEIERLRLRKLFDEAPALMAILHGPKHVFALANALFLRTVGRRDVVGKPVSEVFPEVEAQGVISLLDRVYVSGETFFGHEFGIGIDVKGDGTVKELYFNFIYQALRDIHGGSYGIMVHAVNVTDQVLARRQLEAKSREALRLNLELEARVAERTAALEEAYRELETFSYSVSHDLRTPISGIDGFSQALLEDYGEVLDDRARGYLARIRHNAGRMSELIDAMLELSLASRKAIVPQEVDLGAMAHEIIEGLRAKEPGRQVVFSCEIREPAQGDAKLLHLALENLLANAWKFAKNREVARIDFSAADTVEGTVYRVRDNGVGFDPRHAHKLFEAFERLHRDADFSGTGIGLATVERIVRRHGGRIWAEAEIGVGATFCFTLGS